ncbi:MAG: PAS domain-containing protein [Gemmatimonadetes bacterium]|nr:PAS domain-containing protein [Gemmatimonadota bacterium]
MATLAADGTVLEVNRAAAALGAGTPPAPDASFRAYVPPAHQEAIAAAIAAAHRGEVSRLEVVYHVGDGPPRAGEATIVPWKDPAGRAVALGILRDTSREQEIRSELVQMGKLATAGELLAGVTHELNNPLAAVLSLAELLAERPDLDPEVRDDLQEIRREAQRAANIVRQLLAFVRRHDPMRLPLNLNPLVRDTIALRRGALRLAGIDVELKLADVPAVAGDEHQLQQMLLNLLTNAEHAMATLVQGRRLLEVATARVAGGLELIVRDTGAGIPPDVLPRIFDPFVTTKRAGEGTGLGLSIVNRVVREHGGRAVARNHPDGGAVFTVFLPEAATPAEPG